MWAGEEDYLVHAPWFARSADGKGLFGPFRHLFRRAPSRAFMAYTLGVVNTAKLMLLSPSATLEKSRESIEVITDEYKGEPIELPPDFQPGFWIKSPEPRTVPSYAGLNTGKPKDGVYPYLGSAYWDSLLATKDYQLPYEMWVSSPWKPRSLEEQPYWPLGGKLAFLNKDGACKIRPICLPIAEHQVAFAPLHDALNATLRGLREDCTFKQEEGAAWAHDCLKAGRTLHSIDLKSATDRFPRELQLAIVASAGLSARWINAFRSAVSMPHELPKELGGLVTYTVGQPMGYYASFPLLALGQHGLVRLAAYNTGRVYHNRYRVLGDDIVISDDLIAEEYLKLLRKFDIPVSVEKCLVSDQAAEFAGFLISREHGPIKGPRPPSDDRNFDSLLRYVQCLGKIPKPLLGDKDIWVAAHALKKHGGLGLNPSGLSRSERDLFFDPIRGTGADLSRAPLRSKTRQWEYISGILYRQRGLDPDGKGVWDYSQADRFTKAFNMADHIAYIRDMDNCEFLISYLKQLNRVTEERLKKRFPSLHPIPGILDHVSELDPTFLTGSAPYEAVSLPRKALRKIFPYAYLGFSEGTFSI